MDDVEPDLWVLVRQSDAFAHCGWTVRNETDRASALRHYVQNVLIARCAITVQALPGSSALSLRRQRAEFMQRLRQLDELDKRDLTRVLGEIERLCGRSTSSTSEAFSKDSARRVLARADQQLAASRQARRIETLRDALVELADLLRERPAEHTRFFDSRSFTARMPAIDALADEFGGSEGDTATGDDLWLVPVRRI
ncbi:MAG: hypothetical protein KDH17_14970 [Rhodocyclaceae bacterium]|nr:hypothetical protein [Rhodocyclaceae bacterium]